MPFTALRAATSELSSTQLDRDAIVILGVASGRDPLWRRRSLAGILFFIRIRDAHRLPFIIWLDVLKWSVALSLNADRRWTGIVFVRFACAPIANRAPIAFRLVLVRVRWRLDVCDCQMCNPSQANNRSIESESEGKTRL